MYKNFTSFKCLILLDYLIPCQKHHIKTGNQSTETVNLSVKGTSFLYGTVKNIITATIK
jgi:hypothetical protein